MYIPIRPIRAEGVPIKQAKPIRILLPAFGALLALAFLSGCEEHEHVTPTVLIVTPANGSTVTGPDVLVRVATSHFQFANAAKKATAAQHDEGDVAGHIHVYLDRPVGLDADAIKLMTKSDTVTITGVKAGAHYLIVQGASAAHADYDDMIDSVAFTVK